MLVSLLLLDSNLNVHAEPEKLRLSQDTTGTLIYRITVQHTMTQKTQDGQNNRTGGGHSQDYPTNPNSWKRKVTYIATILSNKIRSSHSQPTYQQVSTCFRLVF